jgi:1,4-alpha-glucan branching enzyme
MPNAYLVLALNCHLPYVRHPEHDEFLEEDWLYEAVAETYLPLLHVLWRLRDDAVPSRVCLSISPPLCEMLENTLLQHRCRRYLERRAELAESEAARPGGDCLAARRMYGTFYRRALATFVDSCGCRLLPAFAELAQEGRIELMASAATHALLPLLGTPQGRRAQVSVGVRSFRKHFGHDPTGFWLPECAYEPGVERLLAQFGIGYTILETHGLLMAQPPPQFGVFAPLETPAGVYAFGRDVESSRAVWSATEGYPGDPAYREFHRDLGLDGPDERLGPCRHPDGLRRPIGLKYYRVTGGVPLDRKEPYDPEPALLRAAQHARAFVRDRAGQAARVRRAAGCDPAIVAPYDAELFGHWWFEGPAFLEGVLRAAAATPDLECVTPTDYIRRVLPRSESRQTGQPALSTWGDRGYFEVWVNRSNDWLYQRVRRAEAEMVRSARRLRPSSGDVLRAMNQCARELLLAQSSDWAFHLCSGGAARYAAHRFEELMNRFDRLLAGAHFGRVDPGLLRLCERQDDLFPDIDFRAFDGRAPAGPSD